MAICKGCGAEIQWLTMPSGSIMPVDTEYIELDPKGIPHDTVVTDDGEVIQGCQVHDDGSLFQTEGKVRGRVPHWVTCPKAGSYRGKR